LFSSARFLLVYFSKKISSMKNNLVFLLVLCASLLSAQSSRTLERTLAWADAPTRMTAPGGEVLDIWQFAGCSHADYAPTLPLYNERFLLDGPADLVAEVESVVWAAFDKKNHPDDAALGTELRIRATVEQEGQQFWGRVTFHPMRQVSAGRYERATAFRVVVRAIARPVQPTPTGLVSERGTTQSVLADGEVYKFGVQYNAVYKLDYDFLKNKLGITNLDQIDPRTLRVYGNGGTMLPERNSDARPDDLLENAIFVSGEADGRFDAADYVLFYAVGPTSTQIRTVSGTPQLTIRQHLYDRHAWYFVKIGSGTGLRISEKPSVAATAVTDEMDDVARIEDEKENLLDFSDAHQGSGKRWWGDRFEQTRTREYTLGFPNVLTDRPASIRAEFAARHSASTSVRLTADGKQFSGSMGSVALADNNALIAQVSSLSGTFTPDDNTVQLKVEHIASGDAKGWLDFIEVNARRRLLMDGNMMHFQDLSATADATKFRLGNAPGSGFQIWDITEQAVPQRQQFAVSGGVAEFGTETAGITRRFVAFLENADFPKPENTVGRITAQNLHGISEASMVIVYPAEFEAAAQQLAKHRQEFSGLSVAMVRTDQLYNEFASGAKDPVAIRDFARLLYEREGDNFKYLLLFGDGSFDPKNNTRADVNNDFVPVWETEISLDPIQAHPADDFFGLLSPNEDGALQGAMEIAVGRIPCNSTTEAEAVVRKIIAYDREPQTLGDWHLRLLYAADDDEPNHLDQAEDLSENSLAQEKWFNVDKVYFDAYQRVATSSEKRIPDAKAAINANIFRGALVVNYIGHGGPKGWAQERVVDLAGWENQHKQPLFITATCSFGGYDDPSFVTGGEQILLKTDGGGIGLFTTVRPVYISANDVLTDAVQQFLYQRDPSTGQVFTIGDILKKTKNTLSGGNEDNARRFALLGDPALRLALPEYRIRTDSINGQAVSTGPTDTISALQRVRISGSVTDLDGSFLPDFNGRVFVTVYDKPQSLTTLALNGSPLRTFSVQRNVLFRGSATVQNGRFTIRFVVPKDINYIFGLGKISYYAENGTPLDAAGADVEHLVIGGTSSEVADDEPPVVQPFLNTDAFVFGGITDEDPKVLIKCRDDNGMNVSGTSLGHDLTAVLDGNVLETIILNEFYEAKQDNPLEGQALYPLRNLSPGKHTLQVKGWDVANNPGEGYTEFFVAEDGRAALDHVLNYPNPFTTNTAFQFEHNLAGQVMDVQISIFTVSGRLVKTLQRSTTPDSYRVTDIEWDGRDDYGDQLARGVYVYRVKLRGTALDGQQVTAESDFERLVILK
jgi:Peptidase family C25/FlgD Ig-like domain